MPQVNIKKRGDKYQYYFEVASVDGKRKRKTKDGFKTKREALEAGTKALAEYNNTGIVIVEKKISFADYLSNDWMNRYCKVNLKPSTVENYRKKIKNHIIPEIGSYYLNSLNSAVLQDFINRKFNEGLSRNSLSVLKGILTNSLNYAVETLHYIKQSPMIGVKIPGHRATPEIPSRSDPHIYLCKEVMDRIFERFPYGTSAHIPLQFGYRCGLRHGEAFAVQWSDIDFDKGTLSVNHQMQFDDAADSWILTAPKYDSYRTIELDDFLLELLRKEKAKQESDKLNYDEYYTYYYIDDKGRITEEKTAAPLNLVTVYENGKFISPRTTMHTSSVIHYDLGYPDFDFHSLRHTHCTMLLENGANPKYVQMRLGHKNINVTMNIYNHLTEKTSEEGKAVLNSLF